MIYLTVKVARGPARLAGFGELQSFIERGLYAFKKMKGARRFLDALAEREMQVLNAIYDGEPAAQWVGDAVHGTVPVRG
jgi:hypothetical protein